MPTSHVSSLGHATAPDFRQKNLDFLCFSFVIYFDFISADEDLIAGDSNHPIRAAGAPSPISKGNVPALEKNNSFSAKPAGRKNLKDHFAQPSSNDIMKDPKSCPDF